MKRLLIPFAAITAWIGLACGTASASVLTDSLSLDGVPDLIQDNSTSLAIFDQPLGTAGHGEISPGDIFAGFLRWNVNFSDGVDIGKTAAAIFAAKVLSGPIASPGGNVVSGDPLLHFELGLAPGVLDVLLPSQAALLPGGTFGKAIIATFSNNDGTAADPTTQVFAAGLANMDTTAGAGNWVLDATAGFLRPGVDYFEAELRDHNIVGVGIAKGQDGKISLTDADGDGYIDEYDNFVGAGLGPFGTLGRIGVGATTGLESALFSVLINNLGAQLLTLGGEDLAGVFRGRSDLVLTPSSTLIQPTAGNIANGYAFADQAQVVINPVPVPEPASLMLWTMGLVGVVASGYSRRRRIRER